MTDMPGDRRFAPPDAVVADMHALDGGLELATRWSRLWASLLDGVILMVTLGAVVALGGLSTMRSGADAMAMMLNMLIGLAVYMVFNSWLLYRSGQTIGKKLLAIRIVRTDGSRAGFLRIVALRIVAVWVLSAIPIVGSLVWLVDVLMIFRDNRQCLHDMMADTLVVTAASAPAA